MPICVTSFAGTIMPLASRRKIARAISQVLDLTRLSGKFGHTYPLVQPCASQTMMHCAHRRN